MPFPVRLNVSLCMMTASASNLSTRPSGAWRATEAMEAANARCPVALRSPRAAASSAWPARKGGLKCRGQERVCPLWQMDVVGHILPGSMLAPLHPSTPPVTCLPRQRGAGMIAMPQQHLVIHGPCLRSVVPASRSHPRNRKALWCAHRRTQRHLRLQKKALAPRPCVERGHQGLCGGV